MKRKTTHTNLIVDGRMILKWNLQKQGVTAWTIFMLLRTVPRDGHL
jgi:hypothetical protein